MMVMWFVIVKAKLGASREKLEELKSSPDLEACSQAEESDQVITTKCQHLMSQAMELGFANVTVYYNDDVSTVQWRIFR